jgi:hypothetical protein
VVACCRCRRSIESVLKSQNTCRQGFALADSRADVYAVSKHGASHAAEAKPIPRKPGPGAHSESLSRASRDHLTLLLCPICISIPSPLLTYHHAVQTFLARRFGKYARPTLPKTYQLTPPRAGPSALLRCKPFDRRAEYAKLYPLTATKQLTDMRPRLRHHQHRHLQADQVRWQVHSHPYPRYAPRKKQGRLQDQG